MNEAKGTDPLRVTLVSYPPYPVRSARRAGPSGRRSDGRGTEGDDKRSGTRWMVMTEGTE